MFVLDGAKTHGSGLQSNCVLDSHHKHKVLPMRSNITKGALTLVAVAVTGSLPSYSEATQYKKIVNGKEVIVHTNPIPVVLHRLVPPQHGRHVTAREVNDNSGPSVGRILGQRRK